MTSRLQQYNVVSPIWCCGKMFIPNAQLHSTKSEIRSGSNPASNLSGVYDGDAFRQINLSVELFQYHHQYQAITK